MIVEGDFAADGAVCVRGAFGTDHLDWAAEGIEAVLADPSPLALRASDEHDGAFVEDFCRWSEVPAIERLARTSPAAAIAGELTESSVVRLYHDHVLVKEPGTRQRTPWHQDQPYYDVDGNQAVSVWLPIDPVPVKSSLQVVAGTHGGPWFVPRTFLDHQARWFPEGSLDEAPDFDADPDRWRVLSWALEPGDAVFFHFAAVHGAPGVLGPDRRRVISLRFLGDDVRHAPRPWTTSPPFPGLADDLAPGAPMDDPRFPVVWTAPGVTP